MFKPAKKPVYLALLLTLSACGGGGGSSGSTDNGGGSPQMATVSGKVVDGYINGATVFCDASHNSTLDAGEASATSRGQGDFTLPSACSVNVVSTGGTDLSTGFSFKGVLKAPAGATVVSPLTTLIAATGLSNADLVKALSLPAGTDLTNLDPAAPGNSTVMKATLAVQQIVQQLANLMGTDNHPGALARLYTVAASSLASTLAAAPGTTLFDPNGTVNMTLLTATIQKSVENVGKDTTLNGLPLTAADIASVASQVAQQAEAFTKSTDANLTGLTMRLQHPQLPPPQSETARTYYIAPKNDSVILNGTSYTLSQFNSPGITLAGLNAIGFEYTATPGTQVDQLADVGMAMEEVGGQGRVLQVDIAQVRIQRNATSGAVTLALTPESNVYVYAKDSRGNELNVTVAQPSFNPVTVVNNAVTVNYATLVEKVVGNEKYNSTSFTPSQFFNMTGNFKAKFVVSNNMNVRYENGTPLPVLTVGITNTSHSVTGPGTEGSINIQ